MYVRMQENAIPPKQNGYLIEFSLNVSNKFAEISYKKYLYLKWLFETATFCVIHHNPTTELTKTQLTDRIFKLTPNHASVIYQILWIRENSISLLRYL